MANQQAQYHVSAFIFRRTLALGYCSAFLSLLAQAPGLFGCDGVFPPKKGQWLARLGGVAVLVGLASLGTLVAGAALAALGHCERYAFTTYALLWVTFASCVALAPALYPALEDRLLLEVGLVALFLVAGSAGKHRGSGEALGCSVGRILSAWLLFRAVFATCAQRVLGSCSTWRSLMALANLYQIEVFPLTPVWLLWLAPAKLVQALTFLQIYVELVLSPLVLVPKRSVSTIAAAAQLLAVLGRTVCANQGFTGLCLAMLALSLLDDGWHNACWSVPLLRAWGCSHLPGDDNIEESEDDDDDDADGHDNGANGSKEDKESNDDTGVTEDSGTAALWVLLIYVGGFIAGLALIFKSLSTSATAAPQQEPLFFLAASEVGHMILASFVATAALVTAANLLRAVGSSCRRGVSAPAFGIIGCLVWLAGLLQLVRDLSTAGTADKLPVPLPAAAHVLETLHLAHPLGRLAAGEEAGCPDDAGRADIVLQAALQPAAWRDLADDASPEVLRSLAGSISWASLSSRFLPATDDRRPVWLQPYTPRLDRELWRMAQASEQQPRQQQMKLPKWCMRVIGGLSARQGSAASLSAGPWNGPMSMIHGTGESEWAKRKDPVLAIRVALRRKTMVDDVHSNKWWNITDSLILRQIDAMELKKAADRFLPRCAATPSFLSQAPLAEGLLAVVIGGLLWKLILQGPAKK